jgi:hypothetical protein
LSSIYKQEYDWWCERLRYTATHPSSMVKGKVIETVTLTTKQKWITNKKFEKIKQTLKDPLQPDKLAKDTMWITKQGGVITLRYKKSLIQNTLTGKLEEYNYDPVQSLERIDGS